MAPSHLQADVYVSPQIPIATAGRSPQHWSPISSTLIRGKHSAVLVDTPITTSQNMSLITWLKRLLNGRTLTTLYITHGHADHFMGISLLQSHFPGLKAVATKGTVRHMEQQLEPAAFAKLWEAFFPGQLPERVGMAEEMDDSGELWLEGHVLKAIEVGHADTYDSTVLHVPDLELVVCGDVVYGDVHQFLVEANTKAKREEWIRAVERVKELNPKVVVPGHKREGAVDGVWCLDATIGYLRDFGEFLEGGARDGKELFGLMMVKYGGRVNEHALLGGCKAAFSTRKKSVL